MKFNNKTVLAAAALMLASTQVNADVNPWTECGIGAMIFDETPGAAAISNIIWDFGTTAVTSAGSSKNTCEGKNTYAANFIFETYPNIEEETVNGNGVHLNAMLNILGCDSSSHSAIISNVRGQFSDSIQKESFADQTRLDKSIQYYNILQQEITTNYAALCSA